MRTMIPILRRVPMPTNSDYRIECQCAVRILALYRSVYLLVVVLVIACGEVQCGAPTPAVSRHTTPPPGLRAGLRAPWASCAVTLAVAA